MTGSPTSAANLAPVSVSREPLRIPADLEEKTSGFTGRSWVFRSIDAWLTSGNARRFLVVGEPGTGKSALAARMACPDCHGGLSWTTRTATCAHCRSSYGRVGQHWDFTTATKLRYGQFVPPGPGVDVATAA